MCADQVILLVVSHRLMTNLLLADLQVQLAVVEELNLGRVQIEMGQAIIRTEMGQVILRTAHLHILMQTERVLARLDEELPHLLGTGEVGTLREGTKALSWRQALPRLVYAQVDDRRSRQRKEVRCPSSELGM